MLLHAIDQIARVQPNGLAIASGSDSVTYAALVQGVRPIILKLVREGLLGPDILALDLEDPVRFIRYVLAAITLGCRVLPIPPSMGEAAKTRLLAELRPQAVIDSRGICRRDSIPYVEDASEPGAMLHLTSGSYGLQKVVVRPFLNLYDETAAVATHLGLRPGHRLLAMTPLSHSFGSGLWRATLYSGASLYVPSASHLSSRLVQIERMLEHGVDFLFGVPYLFQVLLKRRINLKQLAQTRCFAGGEALPTEVARQWLEATGTILQQEYGLGEGGITTLANVASPSSSIGSPIPGVKLAIQNLMLGGIGELVVYRNYAPRGYFLEGAAETFALDGGIRTGDLVRAFDSPPKPREYCFVGRTKSVIVVAGLKLVPQEVEDAIRTWCPGVEEAAVIGAKDEHTGERPVAFVTLKPSASDLDHVKTIRGILKDILDSYKIPKRILEVQHLPRTVSGKVDRDALQAWL